MRAHVSIMRLPSKASSKSHFTEIAQHTLTVHGLDLEREGGGSSLSS